ncbi:glycosyltransferase family 8 protein [Paracoccus xiamenensis]|uniref:glycosyltransferase family 8 protein n=1 Tax=Paracoccus xiamenensis TaxID=2714901 RepID=UPI001407455C|nr:glycosyltransferase [Paracoccus xiamenensis]NHF72744.1 hypothetical protein [Paracoccus xiamenensis]
MIATASRPAEHPDAAIFACDSGHLPFAWVAALQIARLEPGRRFDVVIASPDCDQVPPHLVEGPVRWVTLDTSAIPQITHPNARITLGTFYRHLLPELLQHDYARLLYMDTDTWLRRPGIQGLFDRIEGDWPLAAALTFLHQPELRTRASRKNREQSRQVIRDLGGTKGRFFQSGVMVMQTGPHVAAEIGPRTLEFAATRFDLLKKHKLGDQAAMNGAAADLTVTLDPRWNWHLARWRQGDLVARFDPFILHFAGAEKPWLISDDPTATEVNAAWFADLARWDPDFRPQAAPHSQAWRAQNPRFGVPLLDALRSRLRSARLAWKHSRPPRMGPKGIAAMQRLVDAAEIR